MIRYLRHIKSKKAWRLRGTHTILYIEATAQTEADIRTWIDDNIRNSVSVENKGWNYLLVNDQAMIRKIEITFSKSSDAVLFKLSWPEI